jgi:hypothetical protein
VIASDGEYSDTLVVALTVLTVNDPPVITSADKDTATEDIGFSYTATATDPDNTPVISFANVPSWLSVTGVTVSGTPLEGTGDTSFTIIASDGELSDIQQVLLTVLPVNDPPVITSADKDTATEDIGFSYTATATDPDDTPAITFVNVPSWLSVNGASISGTPLEGTGDTSFSVIASDGEYSDTLVVALTVLTVNDPPVITSADKDTATEDIGFSYTAAATDPDNTPVISFENIPSWLSVSGNTISGVPTEGVGDTSFTVIASDGELSDTQQVLLTVIPVNDPPVITSADKDTATEDIAFSYTATATDPDDIPVITFANVPSWLTISGATLSGTPTEGIGDTLFMVIASDGELSDTLEVALTVLPVNDPPVVTSSPTATATEDVPFTYVAAASDPDDVPSISFANVPSWLSVSGDTLKGTALEGTGDTSFSVIASDNEYSDTVVVTLTVVAVNDPPVITSADRDTATEDIAFEYIGEATDPDSDPVISFINVPSWLSASGDTLKGSPLEGAGDTSFTVIASDGELSDTQLVVLTVVPVNDPPVITSTDKDTATEDIGFSYTATASDPDDTPVISFANIPSWLSETGATVSGTPLEGIGDTSFTIIASDGELSDTQQVVLTVLPVNDQPVVTSADKDTATEDIPFSYTATATDPDDTPVISFANVPSWLSVSESTISGVPTEGMGDTSFTVIASDGELSDTQQVVLTVIPVNDPPVITSADKDTATEDIGFSYTATASDPDDTPAITFVNVPSWLSVTGPTVSGTPIEGTGDTSFSVIASDGEYSDTLVVALTVLAVNDPPVITSADKDTATEDIGFSYTAAATDPDNTPVISFENIPSWLSVSGNTISGIPTEGIGDTSFTVIASDGELSDTQQVVLTVIPVNDPPVITSEDKDTATEDIGFSYTATASDPDDTPAITFVNVPSWLSVTGPTVSGTPIEGTGDTSFSVIASDGEYSDTLVVALTVLAVNDPPVITSANADTAIEEFSFSYTATATDPDDTPVISFANIPSWLSVAGATISGTPLEGTSDTSFAIIATDGELSDTQQVVLTVLPVNDPPVVTSADTDTATEDIPFSYTATATDPDDTPVISFANAPSWLSVSGSTISGVPTEGIGDTSFSVIASDGELSDTLVVTVIVEPVNDPPVITSADQDTATEDIAFSYTATATDPDDTPVIAFANVPSWLSVTGPTISGTPLEGTGDTSFTVIATDYRLADTVVVAITVLPVNDPPTITSTPDTVCKEDESYSYQAAASDPDIGDQLSYQLLFSPSGMTVNSSTGLVTWPPENSDVGAAAVTLEVRDGEGLTDVQHFILHVLNTNDAPQITSVPVTQTYEDSNYTYDVNAADADLGDVITYVLVQGPAGMAVNPVSGLISWLPGYSDVGSHTVTVQARDDSGSTDGQTYTLEVIGTTRHTVTALAYENGQISPSGSMPVKDGDSVQFIISPDEHYDIDSVIVNNVYVGKVGTYTFRNVRGDSTIRAVFKIITHTVTSTAGQHGSISPQGDVVVNDGDQVSFTMLPDNGYVVSSVTINGNPSGIKNSYIFYNVRGDSAVHVEFEPSVGLEGNNTHIPDGQENMKDSIGFVAYPVPQAPGDDNIFFSFKARSAMRFQLIIYDVLGYRVYTTPELEDDSDSDRRIIVRINIQNQARLKPGGYVAFLRSLALPAKEVKYAETPFVISD